jgi:hypothetical protein
MKSLFDHAKRYCHPGGDRSCAQKSIAGYPSLSFESTNLVSELVKPEQTVMYLATYEYCLVRVPSPPLDRSMLKT